MHLPLKLASSTESVELTEMTDIESRFFVHIFKILLQPPPLPFIRRRRSSIRVFLENITDLDKVSMLTVSKQGSCLLSYRGETSLAFTHGCLK
jgi:hypothetical protein